MYEKALWVFACAAVVGVYMAVQHARGKTPPPVIAAALHGILAVAGVVLLLMGVMAAGTPGKMYVWSLGLFVVAALGGLYLVSHHFRGKPLPGGIIALHGLLAVAAFVILLLAVLVLV